MSVLYRAKESFAEACSGTLRGRETFVRLLRTQSDLRLSGLDPATDAAYVPLGTTREKFNDFLLSQYRRAARENYEDATEGNFRNANRPIREALSDLHLVPVYMELGGLDPARDESWEIIGVSREDYKNLQRTHQVAEAKKCFDLAHEPGRGTGCRAMEDALWYLQEAGLDLSDEQTYRAIGTSKAEFDAFLEQKRQLTGYRPRLRI